MSYQYNPTCYLLDANMQPMTVSELETYFGRVEQHYGTAESAYRVAALKWSESSMQEVLVLDESGRAMQGVTVIYRLADGGEKQEAVTNASGKVAFVQPDQADYNVPADIGPMAVFIKDQDSVIRCGNVHVQGGPDRHLDVVFRWGKAKEYGPGSTPPPTQPPVDPPTQPPAGYIEVIDYDGNVASWDWLVAEFGPDVYIEPRGDWECFRLLAKTGPSSIVTTVQDSNGSPVPGVSVACNWPDGVASGVTDGAGAWGFAMGRGSYYHPEQGEHGCHNIWLTSVQSDKVHNLGMLGGTAHDHLEPWFRPRTGPVERPSVPDQPEEGEAILTVNESLPAGMYKLVKI